MIIIGSGKEFVHYEKHIKALGCGYYLASLYSSWGSGLNENTNGRIRKFFHKDSEFEEIAERSAKRAKGLLNRRPRKIFELATLTEVFFYENIWRKFCVSRLILPSLKHFDINTV